MAAVLESLQRRDVELCRVLNWLRGQTDFSEDHGGLLTVRKQEFVPFLLNFLRDQSSNTLTHGPSTPAKTPGSTRSLRAQGSSSERRASNRASASQGTRSASRVQLFSPAPSTPHPDNPSEQDSPQTASQNLTGVSAFSSPTFRSGWSPAPRHATSERRSAQRHCLADFMTSPPDAQVSPTFQTHRGRRRSSGFGASSSNRHTGARGGHFLNAGSADVAGRKERAGGRVNDPASPPTQVELNFNNFDDFPPVGASHATPKAAKPSRRINPTPVSAERPNSKPESCFTSTPLSKPCSPPSIPGATGTWQTTGSPLCLQEERELLKKERSKLAQQSSSPLKPSESVCTPTKSILRSGSKVAPDPQAPCPDPTKVTHAPELELLAELYSACISENLVPCVFLELFFVLQLLTSRSVSTSEPTELCSNVCERKTDFLERTYLGNVHNCVYFAVRVLETQFALLSHLDHCTLRLLAENERVATFSPTLRDRLAQAQDTCTAKVIPSHTAVIHTVPFQPATDNRTNFSSDKAFHIFKKQRDIFYELLREWEDYHKEPGWLFEAALGNRVRAMVTQLTAAGSHCHFARLFQKQLVQMCKGHRELSSPGDTPDADLLGMVGADSLGRLKRLQERLIQPQALIGPCPPPSFPGHQEFFRDFLQTASCCQLNQHLKDGLCQQLLQLNEVSILGPDGSVTTGAEEGDGDMQQQDEKQRFSSVLLVARLLAKFLGFISFMPYQTSEAPSREIREAAIALRSESAPALDVSAVLKSCVRRKRTVLTVPWLVEFLSMLDYTGPFLTCYKTALGLLLQIYRRMRLGQVEEHYYLNQMLLVAVLGWLFQIPVIPDDLFFSINMQEVEDLENHASSQGLDNLPLVDQQLLFTCCPYLAEFRKLLAAFVSGSASKTGGLIRKITPTSAEPRGPSINRSQQKLQALQIFIISLDLEQAFFHNQPPSLKRTVEFVAERVGSNCVKHIKATLVSELVQDGEKTLRDSLESECVNAAKLNDSICAQLCDSGMQALEKATRFCSENAPRAVRVLLPDETPQAVLSTSESITTRLATEKACSWLSSNITALIKREWKSTFERVMKNATCSTSTESVDTGGSGKTVLINKSSPGQGAGSSCPQDCSHKGPLASDVIIELKEVLSIAVGPRSREEVLTVLQIDCLLDKVQQTLKCRKFMSAVAEQMLLRCTVLLASKLVSGELPLVASDVDVGNLLDKFVVLWTQIPSTHLTLHLLFTEPLLTLIINSNDLKRYNYLLFVRKLVDKDLLKEEEVLCHWAKLPEFSFPWESILGFQNLSLSSPPQVPLVKSSDILQIFQERADGGRIAVEVEDKVVRVRNVKFDGRADGRTEALADSREKLLEFAFDYCYWSVNPEATNYASQEEVFQDLGMCVLAGANEGYNVCLFAYGQTGSGKTYTMMGNPDSVGLTPRICQGLFQSGVDSSDGQTCRVEVSFLEIYNERVRDLLRGADQKKPAALRVREHPEKGPYVQGLTQHVVEDSKQAIDLLEEGIANRITAATHVHDASSRSHAIFTIQYTQAILENNLPSEIVSKINLVDLAGSERADPNYCRDRITEGANINKSLVTLGIVISALAQNSQMCSSSHSINSMLSEGEASTIGSQSSSLSNSSRRHCFIPYRDSVLTWLLKDSLGGNSKTIMIATISPSCISYNETLSTLRYAAHAKNIVNKPRVNEDASVRLIRELREEIDRLKSMLLSFSMQRNPSPSLSDERDSSLSDIVLQNELKVEQLTKDWSESWRDKRALLEQYGVDINQDRTGVQIHSLQPHLISLEPDVLSTGVTIYHLPIIEGGPLFSSSELKALTPKSREEEVSTQEGSERLASWQRLEEHQHYVECLREEILVEQRKAEKDLEKEQAHLRKQRSEIQQWILQEKQRLAAIREKGTLDSGVQTDILPTSAPAGINENECSNKTVRPSLIVGDRKRVVQEELLKHHALRRNENRIRRKRLRYQLERIARKRHLLEAKQELQRLETALLLRLDEPQSPDFVSPSKRREHPMVLRRHSFSVDLLSRLYPQHTPIFSQFLRRNKLSESTSSLSKGTFPTKWVSDESLAGKPRGRSNTMPSTCSKGTSSRTGSSENIKMLVKENVLSERMTKGKALDLDAKNSKEVLPIIKQPSQPKNIPKRGKSLAHEGNKGLETIRKALSQSVGSGIKMALARVFRKPPLGSRSCKNFKTASRAKTLFAVEEKKDKVIEDMAAKQPHLSIKSTVSCDGLDQLLNLNERKQNCWHSAETLSNNTRKWVMVQNDQTNWVDNNGNEVADDYSDCDSLFSVDSLSSAYAIALAKQLQQEECESSEAESEDSRMSKDSLVRDSNESTGPRPALKFHQSLCHTLHSSLNPQSNPGIENIKSKEISDELSRTLHGQSVTKQIIEGSSHLKQDFQHSSQASVRETEASLALTDAWSSTDAADSPRILGALLKQCILSETSSSQSQASLDLSGATTGSECQITPCFYSTQGEDATVEAQNNVSSERETFLDYFLSDLTSTSCSTQDERTLLQDNNGLLRKSETSNGSAEASITQYTMSNDTLCEDNSPPLKLAALEKNEVNMLVVSLPFEDSSVLPGQSSSLCLQDKSPDNNSKSNFILITGPIQSGDESFSIKSFASQKSLSESKTQSKESYIAKASSRKGNIFVKCDEETQQELGVNNDNKQKSISSTEELHQTEIHNLKCKNESYFEPQNIMEHLVTHDEKEVSDEKTSVQHQVQYTETCSESYDAKNEKDNPSEINIPSASAGKVADSLSHCDAQLELESCNVYSRKRSKDSQDDLAGNLKTPKRSCVESLVPVDSAVINVSSMCSEISNISRRNSTGKLVQVEKDITASPMSKPFQQDPIDSWKETASINSYLKMSQNSDTHLSTHASLETKKQQMSTVCSVGMQDVKCPDVRPVDNVVFDESLLQKIGLAINDKISEVVKEHLNMSLQVDGGEDINEKPDSNRETFLSTNINVFNKTQSKKEMTAEVSVGLVSEYSAYDKVNLDNTNECVGDKNLKKYPTEKEDVLEDKGDELLGRCLFLPVKDVNEDTENSYEPVAQELKINLPEANTVLYEGTTEYHPESSITSDSNDLNNKVISESYQTIQPTLMSTCNQNPKVMSSSKYVTVPEEDEQVLLIKTGLNPINEVAHNSNPAGPTLRTEDNRFEFSSNAQHKPGVYPEVNSISGVCCDVSVSSCCSEAVIEHVVSDMPKKAVNTDEASRVNMAAKPGQVVEMNTVPHLYTESASQFKTKNQHSFHLDSAGNVQSKQSRPLAKLAYPEWAGKKEGFSTQEQAHGGENNDGLNKAKDETMGLEKHNYLEKLHKETTVSESGQTLALSIELHKDSQTQIIQSIIMTDSFQKEDNSLFKNDHTQHREKVPDQCRNSLKERKNLDHLQSLDLSNLSKCLQKPEQRDMTEAAQLNISASVPFNPKEHQVYIESNENPNEGKQHTTANTLRLVFSRPNEERHRAKPKKYRKAYFTAPPSSSTDSTPDSSLDELAKFRVHKSLLAIPAVAGTSAFKRATADNRNSLSDVSSTSLSLEMNKESLQSNAKHNQTYGPDFDIKDFTTDGTEKVRQNKYLMPQLFQISSQPKDDKTVHSTRDGSTHISDKDNNERPKSVENNSSQPQEPILHFGSSDINPFVYTRNKDGLPNVASKNQAFGSAANISSQLTSLKFSSNTIARCCSMDNGLNVQNSPFSSHLSTYACQRGLSSTLSSAEDSKEHISTESKLKEAFQTSGSEDSEKILTATGSDSCNETLELASSSGQVDEIVLVYSSEHESHENKQVSCKCDHGTQTVKFFEDSEKKSRHKRSSTQVTVSSLTQETSTTWTSLQNMSEHLSELIVSTSDLLGNIQCMRTGESAVKNEPPSKTSSQVSAVKIDSHKHCKSDGSTQTAIDVGIQTEGNALQMKQNNVLQTTSPVPNPKSHEVNVIVKVIGSEVCTIPNQDGVIKSIRAQSESRQTIDTIKSMPDLRLEGPPLSKNVGEKFDTVKGLSLENVAPNQRYFSPVTVDHQASNQQIKPQIKLDKRVLLIDRASSPILTVDVTHLQKKKISSGTTFTPVESLSNTFKNPPENKRLSTTKPQPQCQRYHVYTHHTENKSESSISLDNYSCVNVGALGYAGFTDVSSGSYVQNGQIKHSKGAESQVAKKAIWQSPQSHSRSYSVSTQVYSQPDLSQNTLQSSTPINHSQRSSMQEYKHKVYKDISFPSDLSKDTIQYPEEDSMSLAPSECNTDILVSINPLTDTSPLQDEYRLPENLPMHNKFNNWSGISQQPPTRVTNENKATMEKSPNINTHNLNPCSAETESLGSTGYKPGDRRTREIERLRKEREQVLASMQLDLSPHPLSVELTEAKLHYGLGKTDTLLKMIKSSGRTESTSSTKQQLYDRHRRSIDGLRKEREDCLQTTRRARSLSPSKHPNSSNQTTEQAQRAVDGPSRQREYLQQLRKEVVEMSRVPDPLKREGQYPTDIELLLRDYTRAREEAKTEIARARVRLRERTEQEKRRLEQQALSQSVKDHLRLCTRVSNSTLCTGSNLSLSSGPTSGYNSSNAALLKDCPSPSIQITGVSDRELRVRSRPPIIPLQSLKLPRAWLSAQDIRVENSSSGYELHSSSSSPSRRQRTCSFSSPSSISIQYLDIADCTLTSALSEVHLASGGDVRNLLAGNAQAGWRHQGLENGVQTFHRPSFRPSAHGFLGVMELERPLLSLWSLIRDHSKTHLYNKSVKSAWTRLLDDTTQLVYLLTDPSYCCMKQPRDFCCLSTESKQNDMWVLAMQSVFEESLPRPSVDTVRGEMFPSAWVLQRRRRQDREITTVIYLLQFGNITGPTHLFALSYYITAMAWGRVSDHPLAPVNIELRSSGSPAPPPAAMTSTTDFDNADITQQYSRINTRFELSDEELDNDNSTARLFERSRIKALAGEI
ncbi:Codanin-1 [Bagarius yarrelli]|uniref:Codanin-1 n=1 Tax=Bagarius yarrelli TaxID=175774 RepID=A0A556U7J4_BAGYA|nr:Codanin-1 [Bagarius yarrelli]